VSARGDLAGASVLGAIFVGWVVVAELWRRLGSPPAEWTRKVVHLGGGITCLFFPFLVRSPWVVLAMSAAMSAVFAFAGKFGLLRSLHGVPRTTRGAEYYPLAIFLVFLFTRGQEWLYLSAVLVLAVGDAFAALVGSRYGVLRYEIEDAHKSVEGSLVFLVLAFLAIHLPLLLMTDLPRPVCVLAALLVAFLVTGFEAIALGGSDNLWVPLGVVYLLGKVTTQPLGEVIFQNLSLALICLGIAAMVRWIPLFNAGASIAITLYAYGTWALGGWQWALPVFAGLVFHLIAWVSLRSPRSERRIKVRVVTYALAPLFGIVALANALHEPRVIYGPYLGASGAVLSFALANHVFHQSSFFHGSSYGVWPRTAAIMTTTLLGCAAVVVPAWIVQEGVPARGPVAIALLAFFACYLDMALEVRQSGRPPRHWTWGRAILTLVVAGGVLALQGVGVIPLWNPA
jgi:dolichol kinase